MCFLFSPRDSGGLRGASTALWEDGSAGSLEGGPGEGRRGAGYSPRTRVGQLEMRAFRPW